MIAKELRDGWWKIAIGALLILLPTFTVSSYEEIEKQANQGFNYNVVTLDESVTTLDENTAESQATPPVPEGVAGPINPVEYAFSLLSVSYGLGGGSMMMFLAAIFGFSLVSGEVSRGTNFLLLSRPVSRTRILLTKYSVGAGILLFIALLGAIALVVSASLKGYPLGALSVVGLISSIVLLWLGSLSALGLAAVISVVFRDVVASAIVTPLFLALILLGPGLGISYLSWLHFLGISGRTGENLFLPLYWSNESLFMGDSFALTSFLVCIIAAVVPLLAALWLFNRKAY